MSFTMTIATQNPGFTRIVHDGRVVAACALGGAVVFGLGLGWLPVTGIVDPHAIGAGLGAILGVILQVRKLG